VRPFLFFATAVLIVVCDQVSKWAVITNLPQNATRPVIGGFLQLTHTRNSGGAFSLLQARPAVFIVIAVVAIAALCYAYFRSSRGDLLVSGAIALALGGAIGNLIDRVRFQNVVDFFDITVKLPLIGRWPVFNVADSAITVGIVLLAGHFLFRRDKPEQAASASTGDERRMTDEAKVDDGSRVSEGSTIDDSQSTPAPGNINS